MAGILQPPGQARGKCRGSAGCVCCNSGGKVSARPPSLRSPEPLYTKQPPQPGLNFREAVSEEAAARDFSMCFQVKSKPFQLCQETTPLPHSCCLRESGRESGPQGRGLPDAPPLTPSPESTGALTPGLALSPYLLPTPSSRGSEEREPCN